MRSWSSWVSLLVLAAACLGPAPVSASDAMVGGRGVRVREFDGRMFRSPRRPVFVAVDEFAEFGDLVGVAHAPPLVIRVQGDVDIRLLSDGSLRFILRRDDE